MCISGTKRFVLWNVYNNVQLQYIENGPLFMLYNNSLTLSQQQ